MLLTSCGRKFEEIENRELSYMTQYYYKDVTIYILYSLSTLVLAIITTSKVYIYSRPIIKQLYCSTQQLRNI